MKGGGGHYLKLFRTGALSKPQPLLLVVNRMPTDKDGVDAVRLKYGTKKAWKGLDMSADIESVALLPVVMSQDLGTHFLRASEPTRWLLAPRGETGELLDPLDANLPALRRYWVQAEGIFQKLKSGGQAKSLVKALDWKYTLSVQLRDSEMDGWKVLYNASGNTLRAAIVARKTIAGQTCYWMATESFEEALYIAGVISAPVMQSHWRDGKTSKLHFDLSPWRHVPVPKFNPKAELHQSVAEVAEALYSGREHELSILDRPVEEAMKAAQAI